MSWGSPAEIETRRRIKLSVAAYAYEFSNTSIMTDDEFDREARLVDLSISTARPALDAFFRAKFDPSTGMWVHDHPELVKLAELYQRHYARRR